LTLFFTLGPLRRILDHLYPAAVTCLAQRVGRPSRLVLRALLPCCTSVHDLVRRRFLFPVPLGQSQTKLVKLRSVAFFVEAANRS